MFLTLAIWTMNWTALYIYNERELNGTLSEFWTDELNAVRDFGRERERERERPKSVNDSYSVTHNSVKIDGKTLDFSFR